MRVQPPGCEVGADLAGDGGPLEVHLDAAVAVRLGIESGEARAIGAGRSLWHDRSTPGVSATPMTADLPIRVPDHGTGGRLWVAAAEVALVVRQLGMDVEVVDDPPGVELGGVRLRVHERGAPSAAGLRALLRQLAGSEPGLLVVDLIRSRERRLLADAGWSWFERTGQLTIPPLAIDRKVDPVLSAEMVSPDLRRLGLLDAADWPDRPALFAEVAARWRPRWFGLAQSPSRAELDAEQTAVLRLDRGHVFDPGWASVGADAMAAHGLDPGTDDGRQRFYVPDRAALAWTQRFWSPCQPSEATTLLAVPPTPRAVAERCFPDGRANRGLGAVAADEGPWAEPERVAQRRGTQSSGHRAGPAGRARMAERAR